MVCWRFDLSRNFLRYLDGELSPRNVKRIENHLLDCSPCRARLARLRGGQRFASSLAHLTPQHDPWQQIEAALIVDARPFETAKIAPPANRILLLKHRSSAQNSRLQIDAEIDPKEFQAVKISNIEHNTAPHVMMEGYVSKVEAEPDGDMIFRLVEDLDHPDRFVVCEIISPLKLQLQPPPRGSHVRVYGVSRFDTEDNHNWYEVHPVLNIETVRRQQ
jgi:hypothetical protein